MNEILNEFGETLIKEVRDRTITGYDKRLSGQLKSASAQKVFERMNKLDENAQQFVRDIVPDIVDLTLDNLMCMFEEKDNIIICVDGNNIAEVSDGLSGELYGDYGWIKNFSDERVIDY